VAVTGATGNVGSSLLGALGADPDIAAVTAIARRTPDGEPPQVRWLRADVGAEDAANRLTEAFRGVDAVVHLAWLLQPSHDPRITWRTNVLGTERVLLAARAARVRTVVVASSVGAYSPRPPGPEQIRVTEDWPTHGWPTASYTREKAYVERLLDRFERDHPQIRVVRLRPGFTFQRDSAMEQRRLFAGPLLPHRLVRARLVPLVPDVPGLTFQAVHTDDVADAYRLALLNPHASGAYNIAAEPPVSPQQLARLFRARTVRIPAVTVRSALSMAWRLRMVPASPYLFDALLRLPLLDTTRARRELGWEPLLSGPQALSELLDGLRDGAGHRTPPLTIPETASASPSG
jgi:nucleoside-diphosphate-sugar epimerase